MRRRVLPVLALALCCVTFLAPAGAVRAASVTFGTPTTSVRWGSGIEFVQPVASGSLSRVEILVDYPGLTGPVVSEVQGASGPELTFTVDTSKGEVLPNTTLTARWRITPTGAAPVVGPPVSVTYQDTRFAWRTRQGSVVRLHWYLGDDAFAARAIQLGDGAVEKAARLLGATETQPIDFYVYADQTSFYDALGPGTPENVAGEAHPEIRTMFGLITPDAVATSEVARVVTHELTHLVFDTATKNPYDEPAHWINEGLAVYLSVGYGSDDRSAVSQAARDGTIMPLPSLTGGFPTAYDRFTLAYSESVSAIDFLVRTKGQAALVTLIRSYASARAVTDDEAFQAATGMTEAAFDDAWLATVGAATPRRYGPVAAPAGPLPPGWGVAGATEAPGAAATPSASHGGQAPASTAGGSGQLPLVGLAVVVLAAAAAIVVLALRRRSAAIRPVAFPDPRLPGADVPRPDTTNAAPGPDGPDLGAPDAPR